MFTKRGGKLLRLQICRHKRQVLRRDEAASMKLGGGPGKRTRVIDVEDPHVVSRGRLAPRIGIEPGSHHHILNDTAGCRFGQPVLSKSASEREQRAETC